MLHQYAETALSSERLGRTGQVDLYFMFVDERDDERRSHTIDLSNRKRRLREAWYLSASPQLQHRKATSGYDCVQQGRRLNPHGRAKVPFLRPIPKQRRYTALIVCGSISYDYIHWSGIWVLLNGISAVLLQSLNANYG